MGDLHTALVPVIILLLVGILAILFMRRVRLSPIIGYLFAGLLIGPYALGIVHESETTHLLAELGVVFLLFDIGLHFSLSSIWEARRDIFGLGPLQILFCGALFFFLAQLLSFDLQMALLIGGALALSSTAVVAHTIAERRQHNCPVGLTAMAVLIFQDILAIFLLVLAASLATDGSVANQSFASQAALAAVKTAVAFLAAILIANYAIRPLFRLLSETRNEEVFTATALLVVLAAAAATSGAALSLTLGAFLGGMIIAETPYRHVIQTEARPFRNLLLGFFFITVGMSIDWRMLLANGWEILLCVAIIVSSKVVLVAVAARLVGWSIPGAVQLGFLLSQGSEFLFVIVAIPTVHQYLGEDAFGILVSAVAITLALTPTLAEAGNGLARWLERRSLSVSPASEKTSHNKTPAVVIFGLDAPGRTVADALEAHHIPYEAIDGDHERFLRAGADGYPVAFGDIGDVRLMETLSFSERELVVVSQAYYELLESLSPILHERYPDLLCFISVQSEEARSQFEADGFRAVINRSVPCGLDLAVVILRHLGVEEGAIQRWMRRHHQRALEAASRGGTPGAEHVAVSER